MSFEEERKLPETPQKVVTDIFIDSLRSKGFDFKSARAQWGNVLDIPQEYMHAYTVLRNLGKLYADLLPSGIIDIEGLRRISKQAEEENTVGSFVEVLSRIFNYPSRIANYAKLLPEYFPAPILAEIREAWGIIPKEIIWQKYIEERIPHEERPQHSYAPHTPSN